MTASRKTSRGFQSPAFQLFYEDNFLLVVNKQAGFLSVPTGEWRNKKRNEVSLIGEVKRYLSIKSGRSEGATPVHRLDRDTSGLLLIAKSVKIAETIKEQFRARKPEREYAAIIRGKLNRANGTIRSYLATDKDLNQFSTEDEDAGKLAVTHFERVAVFRDTTRIRVRLETGRRNQIRVHFAEAGHPVLGDTRYEAKAASHRDWSYRRLALHAAKLGFFHPMQRKQLSFEAELPKEFIEFLQKQTAAPTI